ncbi:oligosaccharyl transferase alpha subunit [Cristinia sonorae]|uniref:Dolichyl-diphosphooligosaccharide--protein glycosyltransferase subunit 1 n=1 Tax=Cristinia sonorae TaxID=1940300 RepID=A0A8K0XU88_9AGAR|nr:oligosaccharyl transferase alpha subunit [Cristinia sonorae]
MLAHWRSGLPLFLLTTLAPFFAAGHSFENTAIVRTVELGGSVVHVTTTYAVKALEDGASVYTIALGEKEKESTSWLAAKIKGQSVKLHVEQHSLNLDGGVYLYDVNLPAPLKTGGTTNIVVETVQTHVTYPYPEEASQKDGQSLKYESDLLVLSPYDTAVQRTKIRSPFPQIHSYTEPEVEYTQDAAVTKSGATLTYGPYKNIPASSSNQFAAEKQQRIFVHFSYEHPILEITKLERAAEISHWGANLNIQDNINLLNAGPKLKGHFSRLEHQSQSFFQRPAPHMLPGLTLHLPAGIRDVYYYDLVGNVSTSKLRTTSSVPKGSQSNQYSVLELKPRYPIMGGWNYSFTLGWDSPLADSAGWDKESGKWIVGIPVMTLIPGTVVDEEELKIILPEGATDIEFHPPFPALLNRLSTHITYLDTTGRPAITLAYKNLTDKHAGIVYVAYKVPLSAHFKKPVVVATALLGVFALAFVWKRVDTRIQKQK